MSSPAAVVPFPLPALLGGLAIAGLLGAQQTAPTVRPAVGSSVVLEREMQTEASVDGGAAQSSIRVHTLRVEVKGTDPQGNLVVEVRITRVHGSLDHGGAQAIEFDSATSERPDPESEEAQAMALTPTQRSWQIMALAGESFRATVGDNGLVVDIPGAAHLVASRSQSMGFGTTEALLKDLASCAFFAAPPADAAVQSSWTVDLAADAVGPVALRRKWKFEVVRADADRLAVTGSGHVERDDRAAEQGSADASGTVPVGTLSYAGHTSRQDGFVLDATRVESVTLQMRSAAGDQTVTRKRTIVTRRVGIPDPRWHLGLAKRPQGLHDLEPGIDTFVAMYDGKEWSSSRSSPTGKQIAAGLTMLPREEVDALVASLRAAPFRAARADPRARIAAALLTILEFDSEASARRWVRLSGLVSAHENETRKEGAQRFTNAKETRLDDASVRGLLQEKTMVQGELKFDLVTIDAHRGPFVVATSLVGDPPSTAAHLKLVEDVFAGLGIAK
jgi:hypothetical protein